MAPKDLTVLLQCLTAIYNIFFSVCFRLGDKSLSFERKSPVFIAAALPVLGVLMDLRAQCTAQPDPVILLSVQTQKSPQHDDLRAVSNECRVLLRLLSERRQPVQRLVSALPPFASFALFPHKSRRVCEQRQQRRANSRHPWVRTASQSKCMRAWRDSH